MPLRIRLLFGPLAAAILVIGIVGLASWIPGYDHVRQTVSEIGEIGSPVRIPFAILLCAVSTCVLILASAVRDKSRPMLYSPLPAYLIGAMALSIAGVAIFAHPHPLHNVFGISELIGYQAPLAFALTWRRHPHARSIVMLSLALYIVTIAAIVLNLSSLFGPSALRSYVQPRYGLAQRALFSAWFGWSALLGILLSRER